MKGQRVSICIPCMWRSDFLWRVAIGDIWMGHIRSFRCGRRLFPVPQD